MSRRGLPVWTVLISLQALDCISTKCALAHGGYEANGAMRQIVQLPLPVLLLLKCGVAAGGFLLWTRAARRSTRVVIWAAQVPLWALNGVYAWVVLNNFRIAGIG